jgi:Family of unknown function (DUF5317)
VGDLEGDHSYQPAWGYVHPQSGEVGFIESQDYPVKTLLPAPTLLMTIRGRNMFLLAAAGVVMVSVMLTEGRLQRLTALRLRASWLLTVALALQILAISVFPNTGRALLGTMHAASYAIAGAVVFLNRGVRGVPMIGLGGLLNAIAIAANAGTMPASRSAVAAAGLASAPGGFENSAPLASPNLSFLGDIFAIPASWPFHNVFSVGDVGIVLGIAILLHFACGSRVSQVRLVVRLCRWC